MQYLDIDKIIVIIFLAVTLIVGVIAGRNVRDIRDYAVANKSFGTCILLLTLLATLIGGGSTIGDAAQLFEDGIVFWVLAIGPTIASCILARYILPKFDERFHGMISASDLMGYFYGTGVEKFSAVMGFIMSIGFLSMQFCALAHLAANFLGVDYTYCLIVTSTAIIAYSAFGGVRSIAITDVIQFVMLIAMIPIIANVATDAVGGVGNIFDNIKHTSHIEISSHPKFNHYLTLSVVLALPFSMFFPSTIQRYLMAQSPKQIVFITYGYAMLNLVVVFMISCIALSAFILSPEASSKEVIPYIINSYMPPIIKGVAISGMIAVVISTADSFLNAGAVLMAHNALPKNIFKCSTLPLYFAKLFSVVGGVIALIIAMYDYNMVSMLLLSCLFSSIIFGIPLTFGILGLKVRAICFWSGMIAGTVAYAMAHHLELPYGTLLITVLISLFGFVIAYLIVNRSFSKIRVDRIEKIILFYSSRINIKVFLSQVMQYLPLPHNINNYSTKKVKKFGANYVMFGIFCSVDYIVPYFIWSDQEPGSYLMVLSLRLVAGLLCIGLFLQEYWIKSFKKYFALYWHFTLMYCLPFVTTVMFITMKGDVEWLVNFALATNLLALLVDWVSFTILLLLGVTLGYIFYNAVMGVPIMLIGSNTIYLLIYICIFATIIGLLFARRKELDIEEKLEVMQLFGGAIAHEVKSPFSTINMCAQRLEFTIEDLIKQPTTSMQNGPFIKSYTELSELTEMIKKTSIQAIGTVNSLLTSLKGSVVAEDKGIYQIKECVERVIEKYNNQMMNVNNIHVKISEDITFCGSMHYMEQVITNLLNNALKYGGKNVTIDIGFEHNKICIEDNGLGITEQDLPYIFDRFYTKSKDGTGIGLAFCKMVMEDMGGKIKCISEINQYTKFILEFPILEGETMSLVDIANAIKPESESSEVKAI